MVEKTSESEKTAVSFTKFDHGNMVSCIGHLEDLTDDYVKVCYEDESGVKHSIKFRRSPGSTAGWGVGTSKFWRISDIERKKYVYPDTPRRNKK